MSEAAPATNHRLGIIIVGHVDAGKSTLSGRMLLEFGAVDKRQMSKIEAQANSMGRGTFSLAFLLDSTKAERMRGVTIDAATRFLSTGKREYQLVDAPGHKDFVKNMITGTSSADCAVLVIDATPGGFEAGISSKGQTRQHCQLVYAAGIPYMIVAINKMDAVEEDQQAQRYEMIKAELGNMLKKIGFFRSVDYVPFVSISAYKGMNINDENSFPWFNGWSVIVPEGDGTKTATGRTFVQALDAIPNPPSPASAPMRAMITDSFMIPGVGPIAAVAHSYGRLSAGMAVKMQPQNVDATIKTVEVNRQQQPFFDAPGSVGVNFKGMQLKELNRGTIIGPQSFPPQRSGTIDAKVFMLSHPTSLRPNYSPVFSFFSQHMPVKVLSVEVIKACKAHAQQSRDDGIPYLVTGDTGLLVLKATHGYFVVEVDPIFPRLLRFSLRDGGAVIAVGFVKARVVVEAASDKSKKGAPAAAAKKAAKA